MYRDTDFIEIPLTDCVEGDDVYVVALDAETPVSARLRELGVLSGAPVRIARSGSPLIIEVGETRLCLRGSEAKRIRVCPAGSVGAPAAFPAHAEAVRA